MSRTGNVRPILALAGAMALLAASPASLAAARRRASGPAASPAAHPGLARRSSEYLEFLRSDFFSIDADVDGQITQRDVDLHTVMETVQGRTSRG